MLVKTYYFTLMKDLSIRYAPKVHELGIFVGMTKKELVIKFPNAFISNAEDYHKVLEDFVIFKKRCEEYL